MDWRVEKRTLNDIKPYSGNPRVLTKKGLEDLKKSMDKFGLAEPIVINTNGIIIGGHGRYEIARQQGLKEVDVYIPDRELSEEEYRELNVRLNKNIAGEWDFDILANEFELPDLLEWGFDEKDLKIEKEIIEDEVPEVQEEAISKLGEIYQHFINIVFSMFGYCKEIFLWGGDYYSDLLIDKNKGSWVVWDKRQEGGMDKLFGSSFELCWSKAKHKREIARILWAGYFGMSVEDTKTRTHPTQKPVKLVSWFFNKYGNQDDIVLDLFGGSGSTLIACEQLNRKCYMM